METARPLEHKAETIVQLIEQLGRFGYDHETLRLVHAAYVLAASICTCHYRSSGRPILAHCIGLASTLANLEAGSAMIAAAVIHAVYLHGDFGTWRKRVDRAKRARVRRAVGSAAEEIVLAYTRTDRSMRTFAAIRERAGHLEVMERNLVLLRLVDLFDIYGESDALYCRNVANRRIVARDDGPGIVALCRELGWSSLAEGLDRGFAAARERTPPEWLTAPPWKDGTLMPPSRRTKLAIAMYQRARSQLFVWTGR